MEFSEQIQETMQKIYAYTKESAQNHGGYVMLNWNMHRNSFYLWAAKQIMSITIVFKVW